MSSDHHDIKSHVRTYWKIGGALYVFTIITVLASRVHLAVPLAIIVALLIALFKGSMVASVFMHLSNEKRWIYGSLLLTVVFFIALLSLPILTTLDTIATAPVHEVPTGAAHAGAVEH